MKRNILLAVALLSAVGAYAQGTVNFNNVASGVQAPVYNPESGNTGAILNGNTSTGVPAGSTVYTGGTVSGNGVSAQLYGNVQGTAEGSLQAMGSPVFFRTGGAAGFVTTSSTGASGSPGAVVVPNTAESGSATLQLRAWNNVGGTVNSFESAFASPTGIWGKSTLFTVSGLGGAVVTPPNLVGLTSFNIHTTVPEPSTIALAVMGASAFLIRRRKK